MNPGSLTSSPHLRSATGRELRLACRSTSHSTHTAGLASGFVQANLVILPSQFAFDFLLFCHRNPKPCPLIEVLETGQTEATSSAPGSDLRTDLPQYTVWRNGHLAENVTDIRSLWRNDFVSFLIGCSFTFDNALLRAGLPCRHVEQGTNVPMYATSRDCHSAGRFHGKLVVSMRPMTHQQSIAATELTSRMPQVHGAPIHWGNPSEIGIADLSKPDFGDPVQIRDAEIPVFWACGVTPQLALQNARIDLAITHSPGCMFVTDIPESAVVQ